VGWMLVTAAAGAVIVLDRQLTSGHLQLLTIGALLVAAHAFLVGRPALERVAGAPLRAYQLQISIVLGWTVVAKLNPVFLSGAVLNSVLVHGIVPFPPDWRTPQILAPMAIAAILVEAFIAIGLWSVRFRRPALLAALGLHASIILSMPDPLVFLAFALAMGGGYLLFAGEPWQTGSGDGLGQRSGPASEKSTR
jgi:hypothetical protein